MHLGYKGWITVFKFILNCVAYHSQSGVHETHTQKVAGYRTQLIECLSNVYKMCSFLILHNRCGGRQWRQENQKFKVILGYVMSLRLAWDIKNEILPQDVKIMVPVPYMNRVWSLAWFSSNCMYLCSPIYFLLALTPF